MALVLVFALAVVLRGRMREWWELPHAGDGLRGRTSRESSTEEPFPLRVRTRQLPRFRASALPRRTTAHDWLHRSRVYRSALHDGWAERRPRTREWRDRLRRDRRNGLSKVLTRSMRELAAARFSSRNQAMGLDASGGKAGWRRSSGKNGAPGGSTTADNSLALAVNGKRCGECQCVYMNHGTTNHTVARSGGGL